MVEIFGGAIAGAFDSFLQFILSLVNSSWSLVAMGMLAMGDSLVPILPSGTLVSAVGAAAATPDTGHPLWLIIPIAAICALIGDMLVYLIGRVLHFRPKGRLRRPMDFFQKQFDSHWQIILATARFIPIVRVAAFLAAGLVKVPWKRVALMDGIASLVWATVYTLSGYLGGAIAGHPLWGMLIGIGVGALAGLTIAQVARYIQKKRMGDDVEVDAAEPQALEIEMTSTRS